MIYMRKSYPDQLVNLILSGGGVKGIAYVGVFEAGEEQGYEWGNIAGVSAGALAGSFAGAGYKAGEIRRVMDEFDFGKVQIEDIPKKVPAVAAFMEYQNSPDVAPARISFEHFLMMKFDDHKNSPSRDTDDAEFEILDRNPFRGQVMNTLKNMVLYSKAGCLLNGDYLEEWVAKVLKAKGIVTFGDLRGGIPDRVNPGGYRVRMTAVDANRGKIIILPDDIAYYGIEPDKLEVAKAVRMSTSVPFAFKPVVIQKLEGKSYKKHYIMDGGVLDNFPLWLISDTSPVPTVGFRLDGGGNSTAVPMNTPHNILKGLIANVHDIGKPGAVMTLKYVAGIDTAKVSFLDFGLDAEEKKYLIDAGKTSGQTLFKDLARLRGSLMGGIPWLFRR